MGRNHESKHNYEFELKGTKLCLCGEFQPPAEPVQDFVLADYEMVGESLWAVVTDGEDFKIQEYSHNKEEV